MTSEIIKGIAKALYEEFGEDYKIHAENTEQGFKAPCFYISTLEPSDEKKLHQPSAGRYHERHFRKYPMLINFFPKEALSARGECHKMAERLYRVLEEIDVQNSLSYGVNMHYVVSDGVLSFFVEYDIYVLYISEEAEAMELLQGETELKGD